jgi:hypothetical protein
MISTMKFGWRYLFVLYLIPGIFVACGSSSASGGTLTAVVWQLTEVKFDGQSTSNTVAQPDKWFTLSIVRSLYDSRAIRTATEGR